ncbi:MAG TPA: RHS repeat-associated core domain-containing protein [Gaiellaceae bacterium]|nr:RHS repeat-associated core domain-containing protein [Gaiellaceae bacterium]
MTRTSCTSLLNFAIRAHARPLTGSAVQSGNRTAIGEVVSGITQSGTTDSFALSYDGLERLKAITGAVPEAFTLDAGSNIASRTGPATTFSYDTSDRLTGDGTSTFGWDGADRLTGRGADTFTYDALHRLTSSTVAGTGRTFAYQGDGLLASRTVSGGAATALLWDPLTPLARLLQVGSERIVYGLGPLYGEKADGTSHSFARDGSKSVRAEVGSTGAVTKSFRYTAYGELQAVSPGAATPTFLGYNSQLRDGSGLLYLRARWYEPASGRFLTRDPLHGSAASPATLNAFGYGGGNPITQSDPSGMRVTSGEEREGGACGIECVAASPRSPALTQPAIDYRTLSVSIGFVVIERSVDRFDQAYYAFGVGAGFPPAGFSNVEGVMQDGANRPSHTDSFLTGPAATFQAGLFNLGRGITISPLANNSSVESGFYTPQVSIGLTVGFREQDVLNWSPLPWRLQ